VHAAVPWSVRDAVQMVRDGYSREHAVRLTGIEPAKIRLTTT
jgi:hypothetical protein